MKRYHFDGDSVSAISGHAIAQHDIIEDERDVFPLAQLPTRP